MDSVTMMRERAGDEFAHLVDSKEFIVVQNLEGKTLVSRDDLDEWRKLLEEAAEALQEHYDRSGLQCDEDLAVQCEQTAEFIEGFYLPYDEQGKYIGEGVVS